MPAHDNHLHFPSVDVVEASAGSGKTYALARRYVQLLMAPSLGSDESTLKTILAITFTNKASLEMKGRILECIKNIALDAFKNEAEKRDILSSLAIPVKEARQKAFQCMEYILHNYNYFQVQTIDSFINALLTGCAFHLGFASRFKMREDYHDYLSYAMDMLIERMPQEKRVLTVFNTFLEYYLFIENKGSWFSKDDMLRSVAALCDYAHIYGGSLRLSKVSAADIKKAKTRVRALIEQIHANMPEKCDRRFMKSIAVFVERDPEYFSVDDLSDYFKRQEFPIRKGTPIPEKLASLWDQVRVAIADLCEIESLAAFAPYTAIGELLLEQVRACAHKDEIIFLQELNTYAQDIMGNEAISVAELYYRLATRIAHYLIDEFQDTSLLQWRNMFPLVHEALSSGGSLFYVGDKKQAIYRFRGGEVSLFDAVQRELVSFDPKRATLTTNYRSQKEIVAFNNYMFSADNLKRFLRDLDESHKQPIGVRDEDIEMITHIFSDGQQTWLDKNEHGYVQVLSIDGATQDERHKLIREKLLSLINEVCQRFSFRDIAILARDNREVELCSSWLISEGLPVESEKTLNMRRHPLIKEIVGLLTFLDSPIDDLAFAAFILGDIFTRASGVSRDEIERFLFSLRTKKDRMSEEYLYQRFRKQFPHIWEQSLEAFFKNVGFVPLYELVITIFKEFDVFEYFGEYQAFFMKFLEVIKAYEDEYVGLASFLEFFDHMPDKDMFIQIPPTDSIKVMTIHKAKGLEFGVVIMPLCAMDITVGAGGISGRKPYVIRQHEDRSLELVQLKRVYGVYSPELGRQYTNAYLESVVDELNALYVAFTRARYELYVCVPSKSGNKKNAVRYLMPEESAEYGSPYTYIARTGGLPICQNIPPARYANWIQLLREEFPSSISLSNRKKRLRGDVLHFMLSRIGDLAVEDKDICLTRAYEESRRVFPVFDLHDECRERIHTLLESDTGKKFFYIRSAEVFREKEIIDRSGMTKRIDRMIITGKEVWIIDYKSSQDVASIQKQYYEQMREYRRLVRGLYPDHAARCFLIYLDNCSSEEVCEDD